MATGILASEPIERTAAATRRGTGRVLVVTTGMRPLIGELLDRYDVVGLVRSLPRNHGGRCLRLLRRALCSGERALRRAAAGSGCAHFELAGPRDERFVDWVRALAPDLMVVACMNHLLEPEVFSIPRLGTINIHPSALPKYRGPNPIFWMFHDMDREGGVTVHFVDEGEDTGDIIHQQAVPIAEGATGAEVLSTALDQVGAPLLIRAIDEVLAGRNPRTPQPADSPTRRARAVRPGEAVIDWERWEARRVFHFLRGTAASVATIPAPPGPFRSGVWRVVGCEGVPTGSHPAAARRPGELFRDGGRWFVACRDGRVELATSFDPLRLLRRFLCPGGCRS